MFLRSMNIPGSALTAEKYRLNLIAQNIAHAETTRREDGLPGPYKRKTPVYQTMPESTNFASHLGRIATSLKSDGSVLERRGVRGFDLRPVEEFMMRQSNAPAKEYNGGVRILKVIEDPTPGRTIYDPDHPDADEEGYVELPNVEMVNEMVSMMNASRSFEANVQVVNAIRAMAMKALEIGR